MGDQPRAPKGQEWYYRPGTTEPELRPKSTPDEEEEEEAAISEAENVETAKPASKKAVAKKK